MLPGLHAEQGQGHELAPGVRSLKLSAQDLEQLLAGPSLSQRPAFQLGLYCTLRSKLEGFLHQLQHGHSEVGHSSTSMVSEVLLSEA